MRYLVVVSAAAALLTGCAVAGTPTAAPVTDEWRQAVVDAVAGLGTQLGPIANAMVTPDHMTNYTDLHNACSDMRDYIDSAKNRVLPGPDVKVNTALREGFDGYRSMADQCVALTPANSSSRLTKLGDTMDEAHLRIKEGLTLLGVDVS
ncbi:hypothetical protein A5733_03090 [Mycobacterium sp. NS-7484]|uniref:hypothetical protein n=1 Tax=unclassified Mycobacterium TaxID=2642494 RepID=UPI0007FF12CB|nr:MULTISPECIES: hypothetical protein [unclassified Mycobacterium]OBG82662.1 hypothetical protein A5699_05800 [Mycobacterium sp. E802]OMC01037.1 hypothetical protein A5733_03090 [Mycobacterium sp. NS-7484]